jgi:simple sugar transport system permease protein
VTSRLFRAPGWIGVALALLAAFVCLPPLEVRTLALPAVLALAAAGLGVAALRAGQRRPGILALVLAPLCLLGAYGATNTEVSSLQAVFSYGTLLAATLRFATPLTFAALGGLVSERAGVVNIALEGMMLVGAFFAAYGAAETGSWAAGLLIGIAAGVALAAVHALFCVLLRADQIVVGTALNFVALGLSGYVYIQVFGTQGTPDDLPRVPDVSLPTEGLGFLGRAISDLNLLVWLSLLLVVVVWVVVFRMKVGLRLRSVGENPKAAETVGVDVLRMRFGAVLVSGALASLGGAFLSVALVGSFTQNMTAGRGFIALAAVIFGRWKPFLTLSATLLFGFSSALAQRLPEFSPQAATLFQALPYVLTLIAVAGVIGRSVPPAADGIPYRREG